MGSYFILIINIILFIYLGEGAQQPIARVILAASLVLYVVAYSSFFPFIFPYK